MNYSKLPMTKVRLEAIAYGSVRQSHEEGVELARMALATMNSQPIDNVSLIADCDPEVYEKGVSVCLISISKETAEVICKNIAVATGCKVDWHYFGGRVHIKALPPSPQTSLVSGALADVIAERQRQQSVKGFSTEQDDTYVGCQLAAAAICYIEPMEAMSYWPADWHDDNFKPTNERRNLVKAAALILAEIERIDRKSNAELTK